MERPVIPQRPSDFREIGPHLVRESLNQVMELLRELDRQRQQQQAQRDQLAADTKALKDQSEAIGKLANLAPWLRNQLGEAEKRVLDVVEKRLGTLDVKFTAAAEGFSAVINSSNQGRFLEEQKFRAAIAERLDALIAAQDALSAQREKDETHRNAENTRLEERENKLARDRGRFEEERRAFNSMPLWRRVFAKV